MAKTDRISRQLPKIFANGTKIRRFAKPCTRCRHVVEAQHMDGQLLMIDNRLFLAAHAHCPQCAHRFAVACIITPERRVLPVRLPLWLFRVWLKIVAPKAVIITENDPAWQYEQDAAPPRITRPPEAELAFSEAVVGRFQGHDIPAACHYQSHPYRFERVAPAGLPINGSDQEILVRDQLIYRLATADE
jgi:hypothetical protein